LQRAARVQVFSRAARAERHAPLYRRLAPGAAWRAAGGAETACHPFLGSERLR